MLWCDKCGREYERGEGGVLELLLSMLGNSFLNPPDTCWTCKRKRVLLLIAIIVFPFIILYGLLYKIPQFLLRKTGKIGLLIYLVVLVNVGFWCYSTIHAKIAVEKETKEKVEMAKQAEAEAEAKELAAKAANSKDLATKKAAEEATLKAKKLAEDAEEFEAKQVAPKEAIKEIMEVTEWRKRHLIYLNNKGELGDCKQVGFLPGDGRTENFAYSCKFENGIAYLIMKNTKNVDKCPAENQWMVSWTWNGSPSSGREEVEVHLPENQDCRELTQEVTPEFIKLAEKWGGR